MLEPVTECNSDPHSYGYRKYRSAKNAVAAIRTQIKGGEKTNSGAKWVLDADIKGFFDNICHEWILNNVPLAGKHLAILKEWLKAGHIYRGAWKETEAGTPQGGIISPVLANFTLDGLEKAVYDSI